MKGKCTILYSYLKKIVKQKASSWHSQTDRDSGFSGIHIQDLRQHESTAEKVERGAYP